MITFTARPMSREKARSQSKWSGFKSILRLLEDIARFIKENELQVGTAYLTLHNETPELYMVTGIGPYNFELGDKLSEFIAPYIKKGLIGGTFMIPVSSPEEIAAYFDLDKAIRI